MIRLYKWRTFLKLTNAALCKRRNCANSATSNFAITFNVSDVKYRVKQRNKENLVVSNELCRKNYTQEEVDVIKRYDNSIYRYVTIKRRITYSKNFNSMICR